VGVTLHGANEEEGVRSAFEAAGRGSEIGGGEEVRTAATGSASWGLKELWTGAWSREAWLREAWSRETWSRETWTRPALARLVVAFAVLAMCSWMGIMLSRQSEGVATIWFSNGILFGLVITRPRRQWMGYFLAGLAADTLADMGHGDPFRVAIGVSVANSVEVILSCVLLTRMFGTPLNLSKRRPLIGFLLIAVVGAAALTSAIGASWTVLFYPGVGWMEMWRNWYLGDMLGMALLGPLVFLLQRPGIFTSLRRSELPRTLLVLLVPAVSTALVFTHDKDPLMFLLFRRCCWWCSGWGSRGRC